MKRAWIILFLMVASFAVAHQGWKAVTSKEGGFTAMMPGTPTASSRTDQEKGLNVNTKMWVSSVAGTNYVVSVSILPRNAPASFTGNMLDGIKTGFLNSISGKALSDKPMAYAGNSGRLIKFTAANGAVGGLWMLAKKGNIYTMTVAKGGGSYDAELTKLCSSLKLK